MRRRLAPWIACSLAVVLLALLAWHQAVVPGLAILVLMLAVVLAGLTAEVLAFVLRMGKPPARRALLDARPSDGRVEVVPIPGLIGEPNGADHRFARYRSLDPEGSPDLTDRPGEAHSPVLLGKVVLVSVFLGKYGKPWSDAEIAQAHKSLIRAGTWLEREAARWGAPVNLALAGAYFVSDSEDPDDVEVAFVPEGDAVAPLEANAAAKALAALSRAAGQLGFADASDLIGRVGARVLADAWVWLLHPRCAGRSLAIPAVDTPWPGVTLAVCYAREANFPEPLTSPPYPDPVTFVHEMLHLFGATDKYTAPLSVFPGESVTERDVMRLDYESLSRLRIDALTASEIGWLAGAGKRPPDPVSGRGGRSLESNHRDRPGASSPRRHGPSRTGD